MLLEQWLGCIFECIWYPCECEFYNTAYMYVIIIVCECVWQISFMDIISASKLNLFSRLVCACCEILVINSFKEEIQAELLLLLLQCTL